MDPEYYFAFSFFAVIWGIVLVIGLAVFILQAFGLYSLSKNAGYDKPWLAFIPVANTYLLGSLSDGANLRIKGKRTNNRKLLLGLHIGLAALVFLLVVLFIAIIASPSANMYSYSYDAPYGYYGSHDYQYNASMLPLSLLPILLLLIVPLTIVAAVFTYIALYSIYKAYSPENAEMYLVLSILISLAQPIILFCLRNKTMAAPTLYSPVDPNGYYNPAYIHPEYIEHQAQQPGMQHPSYPPQQPGMQRPGYPPQQPGMQRPSYPPQQPGMQRPGYPPQQPGMQPPSQPNGIRFDKPEPAAPGKQSPSAQQANSTPTPTGEDTPKAQPCTPVQPPREDQPDSGRTPSSADTPNR